MQDFKNYFKNPFDTPRISDNNLRNFADDHLQRTKANNSTGTYTEMIAATEPLATAFGNCIHDEDIRRGIKKGSTLHTNQQIQLFKDAVAQREGAIRSSFGTDSPQYLMFFPNGVREYHLARKKNIATLMARMETLTAQYTEELGQAMAAEFAELRSKYELLRNGQLQSFGAVENLRTATMTARQALATQLCINLLLIASKNVGFPDRVDDFMNQSILLPRIRKS